MVKKEIVIDGEKKMLGASALIPRLYRAYFGRDMVSDMRQLAKAYKRVKELPENATDEERQDAQFKAADLEVFENIMWLMLRHGGNENIPGSPEAWLDSISGVFSVYENLPAVLELWGMNQKTTAVPKKK